MLAAIETSFGQREIEINSATRLSPNFILSELSNTSGDAKKPMYLFSAKSDKHVEALQHFRNLLGVPVNVNSGYRQSAFNKKVGGDSKSAHLVGLATDIKPPFKEDTITTIINAWFAALALAGINQGAINVYDNYYHLESFSRDLYSYKEPYTIRVYSSDAEFNYLKNIYRYHGYNIMRVKK